MSLNQNLGNLGKFITVDASGNILLNTSNLNIGYTTDQAHKLTILGNSVFDGTVVSTNAITANAFNTVSSTANITFNTFQTFYTMPGEAGLYFVSIGLDGQAFNQWCCYALIYNNGADANIISSYNSALVIFQLSGLALQCKQTGTSPNIVMSYRIFKVH